MHIQHLLLKKKKQEIFGKKHPVVYITELSNEVIELITYISVPTSMPVYFLLEIIKMKKNPNQNTRPSCFVLTVYD